MSASSFASPDEAVAVEVSGGTLAAHSDDPATSEVVAGEMASAVATAREVASAWAERSVAERLAVLARLRASLVDDLEAVAASCGSATRRGADETLVAEVGPLLEAIRFLERRATAILRARTLRSAWSRLWTGPQVTQFRQPHGVVLILGASNYPLFLAGVQAVQALAAGNVVLLKPGTGGTAAAETLATYAQRAGLPSGGLTVLPETTAAGEAAIEAGVDFVVLTGSHRTGTRVLTRLAKTATPAVMELSGHDAVFVLPGADVARTAEAIAFGLTLNGGATCIAPRRIYVIGQPGEPFEAALTDALCKRNPFDVRSSQSEPPTAQAWNHAAKVVATALDRGAVALVGGLDRGDTTGTGPTRTREPRLVGPTVLRLPTPDDDLLAEDVFAPVTAIRVVPDVETALKENRRGPYRLGASVFGPAETAAALAANLPVGCVTVHDLIAPTADPVVPFGGGGASGFGVTRGADGLLAMTRPRVVITASRRGWKPHHDLPRPGDGALLSALIRARHGRTLGGRVAAWGEVFRRGMRRPPPKTP